MEKLVYTDSIHINVLCDQTGSFSTMEEESKHYIVKKMSFISQPSWYTQQTLTNKFR